MPDTCEALHGDMDLVITELGGRRLFALHLGTIHGVIEVVFLQKQAFGVVKLEKATLENALADFAHEPVIKIYVMLPQQLPSQGLFGLCQVMEVGAIVPCASRTTAFWIQRFIRGFVNPAPQLQKAARSERSTALRHLGGNDAVKHVHSAVNRL